MAGCASVAMTEKEAEILEIEAELRDDFPPKMRRQLAEELYIAGKTNELFPPD